MAFMLATNFVETYKNINIFKGNVYGEIIFLRTYSRKQPDNKMEPYYKVIQRCVEGNYNLQKNHAKINVLPWSDETAAESAQEMYDRMFKMKFLPGGRCLAENTLVLTVNRGLQRIQNVGIGDLVYTYNTAAPVVEVSKSFKPMVRIVTEHSSLDCSVEHKIAVYTNENKIKFKPAAQLAIGDCIVFSPKKHVEIPDDGNYKSISINNHVVVIEKQVAIVLGYAMNLRNALPVNEDAAFPREKASELAEKYFDLTLSELGDELLCIPKAILESSVSVKHAFILGMKAAGNISGLPVGDCTFTTVRDACTFLSSVGIKMQMIRIADNFYKLAVVHASDCRSKIVDIQLHEDVQMYDLSIAVPNDTMSDEVHSFYANGFLVHNSLWAMGTEVTEKRKLYAALYNCSFTSTASIDKVYSAPFKFLMDCLMLGVGGGFDAKGDGKLMIQKPLNFEEPDVFVIPDSREGWVEALGKILDSYFKGTQRYIFDYSQVRVKGTPIKGFGGVASGPAPLKQLFDRIDETLEPMIGKLVTTRNIVDIANFIGVCVVAGNVRRCKPVDTLVFTKAGLKPIQDVDEKDEVKTATGYSRVVENIYQGEQELVCIQTQIGNSWCTPNHRMAVSTADGNYEWKQAKNLVNGDFLVFNPQAIEGIEAKEDDAWTCGSYQGRQEEYVMQLSMVQLDEIEARLTALKVQKEKVPDFVLRGTTETRRAYLNGISDDDQIQSDNHEFLVQLQSVYASLGIPMKLEGKRLHPFIRYVHNKKYIPIKVIGVAMTGKRVQTYDLSVENEHEYFCGEGLLNHNSAEIMIGDPNDKTFLDLKNYDKHPERAAYGWASNNTAICPVGIDYTDISHRIIANGEPGIFWRENARNYGRMNGIIDTTDSKVEGVNPCAETTLEYDEESGQGELCNLMEIPIMRSENLEDFKRTLKFAYLYAKVLTLTGTQWPGTNRLMFKNRRIGCGLTGIAEFIDKYGLNLLKEWCEEGYKTLQYYDKVYSDWLCIPLSKRMTVVKPSGTISILADCTCGVHYPVGKYCLRRVRFQEGHPLLDVLRRGNYKIYPAGEYEKNTLIVEIPIMFRTTKTAKTVSMMEQFAIAAFLAKYWADNAVSVTISFDREKDGKDIARALELYQYQLKTVSMLPIDNNVFPNMPFTEITEEEYKNSIADLKEVDFTSYYNNEGIDADDIDKFCTGETCKLREKRPRDEIDEKKHKFIRRT